MRILIAPDKFKDSLGAAEVAEAIAAGLRDVLPATEITELPVADGGEGTAEAICRAAAGDWQRCDVHDPLGAIVQARYCTIDRGETAVMDASSACGLWRVPPERRAPDVASSFGVGELLLDAQRRGVTKIVLGLGGSATNDGGFGMARALGFRFRDKGGRELRQRVTELCSLGRIERPGRLKLPEIIAAADVRNPLLGPRGATRTFAAQKGASVSQIEPFEAALKRIADVVATDLRSAFHDQSGAGAAGGLGFGLMSFCGAKIASGFDVVADYVQIEKAVIENDIVVTGEGRLDAQTLEGKAPAGVAALARKHRKPLYAIVGEAIATDLVARLFDRVWPLAALPTTREEAIRDACRLLRERARELAATLKP